MQSWRTGGLLRVLNGVAVALAAAGCGMQSRGTVTPVNSGLARTVSRPAAPQSGTLWLIFLDDLHVDFSSTSYLRALLRTTCTELVQAGDMVGIVSTGPSSIAVDLTDDRERILKGTRGSLAAARSLLMR